MLFGRHRRSRNLSVGDTVEYRGRIYSVRKKPYKNTALSDLPVIRLRDSQTNTTTEVDYLSPREFKKL